MAEEAITMEAMEIDLNCDLGEGCPFDGAIMPLITSANVSCGFHAGDLGTAHATLVLAAQQKVRAGAHPGYADREHFGRRELDLGEKEIQQMCVYQVGALLGLGRLVGWPISHLKPHGALYNQACREDRFARPVVATAALFGLPLFGLPGSRLEVLSRGLVPFVPEGFADRRYLPDGSLAPRTRPDAFVEDPEEAVRQADWLIREKGIRSLCVHGDNPQALLFLRELRDRLSFLGYQLSSVTGCSVTW